jgi:2-polyprenyl-6-methoxyphenol hydroxylase-like FAD-dependent oxidoreductase
MDASSNDPEFVIVGGGIAGSAMAISLARARYSVTILEKSLVHADRVRGEFIVPWGVAQARELGLLSILEDAGANYTVRSIPYGEGVSPADAQMMPTKMDSFVPGIKGALNIGHPAICNALNAAAEEAGATLVRGIENIAIQPGRRPRISFNERGRLRSLHPRLIVGADGRGSEVARQVCQRALADPIHHIFTGLLVDGVEEWPQDEQSIGVDEDVAFYILAQGRGRLRIYLAHDLNQRSRFAGEGAASRFLAAMKRPSLPCGEAFERATIAGPCRGYPNNDVWIDAPLAPGVVLIGDAASYSDPAGGQGISSAFHDVRLLSEALSASTQWDPAAFDVYVAKRRERAERTRFSTRLLSRYRMEFSAEARQRRNIGRALIAKEPELALPFIALQKGPYAVPPSTYSDDTWHRLVG